MVNRIKMAVVDNVALILICINILIIPVLLKILIKKYNFTKLKSITYSFLILIIYSILTNIIITKIDDKSSYLSGYFMLITILIVIINIILIIISYLVDMIKKNKEE
jgi:hypothetical protein